MSSGKLTFLHEPNEKETPAFRKRRRSHPSEDAAPTPTSFAEIVSDDFPILHADLSPLPVQPVNVELEYLRAFLEEVRLNLHSLCFAQLADELFVIVDK